MTDVRLMISVMSEMPHTDKGVPPLTLGWRLQMALKQAKMKRGEMADELGVDDSTVSRWMNGHGATPKAAYIRMWALRTGVPYEWLSEGTDAQQSPPGPRGTGLPESRSTRRYLGSRGVTWGNVPRELAAVA